MKLKYFATAALILLLAILLLWPKSEKNNDNYLINITGQEQAKPEKVVTEPKAANKKETKTEATVSSWEVALSSETGKERTYMNVYSDLKLAKRCEEYFYEEHSNKSSFNADDFFLQRFISPITPEYKPSILQLSSFREFLRACDALKKFTFLRANIEKRYPIYTKPYPVIAELEKELEQTATETAAEQALKKVLKLEAQWHELLNALVEESTGPLVMSEEQLASTQSEMMALSTELLQLSQNTENPEEIDMEELQRLITKIDELRTAMTATVGGDDAARNQLLAEFVQLEKQLRKLQQSPHLETFLVAISALEFSDGFDLRINAKYAKFKFMNVTKHIPEYISPSQILREMSGIADDNYYDVLVKPASYLLLCQRGYDCSETSELITVYCWGSMDKIKLMTGQVHQQACGLDVKTFLMAHFLTENQKIDVQNLLNFMEENYAP